MTVLFATSIILYNVSLYLAASAFWRFGVKMREQVVFVINSQVRR